MKKIIGNVIFWGVTILLLLILVSQLGFLPFRMMYVRTGSMVPSFYPGDLAIVYVDKSLEVKSGDVIMFHAGNEPVLHRAIQVENGQITTKGDANNVADSQKLNRAEGKMLFTIPKIGYAFAGFQSLISGRGSQ